MTKPLPAFSMAACSLDTSRSASRRVFAGWRPSVVRAASGNSLSLPSRSRPVRYGPRGLVRTEGTWLDESDSPHAAHLGGLGWASGVRQRGQALSIGPSADVTRLAPVRIKQRPEDFSVRESYRFDPVPDGRYRVYLMDKQKLSTFEAVERIRSRFGLRPGAISFCGLKDKQGRTEQLIAVDGAEVDFQEPDLRLKPLGRTGRPLSAENTTSNRFSVTVRALTDEDLRELPRAAAEVNRLGVVNYFDSQRFGSLKHGQGFIAKDLIRGDFEAALKNYLAKPSPLDRSDDAKVKQFWQAELGRLDAAGALRGRRTATTGWCARSRRSPRTTSGRSSRSTPLPGAAPLHLPELALERGGAAAAPAAAAAHVALPPSLPGGDAALPPGRRPRDAALAPGAHLPARSAPDTPLEEPADP